MVKRCITQADREAAANLKRIFEAQKRDMGLTQVKLRDLTGFKQQSAVSQYLNAIIPLGSEAIFRFAQALNVSPTEIKPTIYKDLGFEAVSQIQVPVRGAIVGVTKGLYIMTTEVADADAVYAVLVDTRAFRPYKEGAHIIVNPMFKPVRGDDVYVELHSNEKLIGEFIGINQHDAALQVRNNATLEINEFPLVDVRIYDVIVAVQAPEVERERR